MPQITPSEVQTFASIKVVGVGGAGGSAINRMKDAGLAGVQFIAMNTDAQALHNSKADVKIHLGHTTTNGLVRRRLMSRVRRSARHLRVRTWCL